MTTPTDEARTQSGIHLPAPDGGVPYVHMRCIFPGADIGIWEPFDDGTEGGHNLDAFVGRWEAFLSSDEPFLAAIDPRFGFPLALPRSLISQVISIGIAYWKREDARAPHRAIALPAVVAR